MQNPRKYFGNDCMFHLIKSPMGVWDSHEKSQGHSGDLSLLPRCFPVHSWTVRWDHLLLEFDRPERLSQHSQKWLSAISKQKCGTSTFASFKRGGGNAKQRCFSRCHRRMNTKLSKPKIWTSAIHSWQSHFHHLGLTTIFLTSVSGQSSCMQDPTGEEFRVIAMCHQTGACWMRRNIVSKVFIESLDYCCIANADSFEH